MNLKRIKKNKVVTSIRRYAAYYFLIAAYYIVRVLPWRAVVFCGRHFGRFVFYGIRHSRKRTIDNLSAAFKGTMSQDDVKKTALGVYENFGVTAFEFLKVGDLTKDEFFSIVDYDPKDNELLFSLFEKKKGVIFASGHLGNWEMLAIYGARSGYNVSVLMEPSSNPLITEFWKRLRKENRLLDVTNESTKIVPRLRANEGICLLFDENAREQGMAIDFFGRPASTYKGAAYLSIKTGAPVACIYIVRTSLFKHKFIVDKVLWPERTGDLEADMRRMLTQMNRSLEDMVRRYPDQWNWMYKRWG